VEGARVLVAGLDGAVAGLIAFSPTHLLEHERPSCRITALVVQPHVRRSGAGTAPLDAAEAEARRLGCFRLEVTCRPTAARRTASTRAAGSASGRAGSSREVG
jgi:GNAT superfamily N-acetyltransferase